MKPFSLVTASILAVACVAAAPPSQQPTPSTQPGQLLRPTGQPPATGPVVPHVPPVTGEEEKAILSDVVQLTDGFSRAGEGYFSQDMKWVIFQATPQGEREYQMYVAPLTIEDGKPATLGRPLRVSPANSRNTCGFFSPDGKDLIFGSTAGKEVPDEPSAGFQRQGGNYRWAFPNGMEIYRAVDWRETLHKVADRIDRVRPENRPLLVGPPPDPKKLQGLDLAVPENRLTNNDAYDAEDAYSPDGKWICFMSRRTGDSEIWVMRSDGSNPVQITRAPGYDGGPYFSPDGKRLVYRSDRKGNDLLQVFIADLAFDEKGDITGMKAEHQLTNDENVNWCPFWHPDGKHLIFATSRQGHKNYELYTMRDDGSHVTRITYTDGFDGLPVFSPDGKWVMWSGKRTKDDTTQLFLARFTPPKDW